MNKIASKHPGPIIHGQKIGQECPIQLNKSKRSIGFLNGRSSTMQRKVRRIYHVHLDHTMKSAPKKLKVPWDPQCLGDLEAPQGQHPRKKALIEIACDSPYGETRRVFNPTGKHDAHASLRPTNPREYASKESQQKDREYHLAVKGVHFVGSLQSCAQACFYTQSNEKSSGESRV